MVQLHKAASFTCLHFNHKLLQDAHELRISRYFPAVITRKGLGGWAGVQMLRWACYQCALRFASSTIDTITEQSIHVAVYTTYLVVALSQLSWPLIPRFVCKSFTGRTYDSYITTIYSPEDCVLVSHLESILQVL